MWWDHGWRHVLENPQFPQFCWFSTVKNPLNHTFIHFLPIPLSSFVNREQGSDHHSHFLSWLTCDIDRLDDSLRDPVPNVHQAGCMDDNIGSARCLRHAAVVCDVSLDDYHLFPLWGRGRKTKSNPCGTRTKVVFLATRQSYVSSRESTFKTCLWIYLMMPTAASRLKIIFFYHDKCRFILW